MTDAVHHDDGPLLAVHDDALVGFLRDAAETWVEAGFPDDPGQDRVVPYVFPHPGLLPGLTPSVPVSVAARTGMYAFDTMTPIGPGTWAAARGAADVALTACDLLLAGTPVAYACTRPPGHHVTRDAYGGSCYLNNAAIAAEHLRRAGIARVAVVDIDAHHGNGAQAIFRAREDVLTGSVHVDPAAGWFPHFLGFAEESDETNRNLPLAPETGDEPWLAAVAELADWVTGVEAIVLALGVDAAEADPASPLRVTRTGFHTAGTIVGALRLPTVVVQEGGYDLGSLGDLVLATLQGIEEASDDS